MISQEAIEKILGIEAKVATTSEEMADKLNITFFPYEESRISNEVLIFVKKLREAFIELKVNVIPYDKALQKISLINSIIRSVLIVIRNFYIFFYNTFNRNNTKPYIHSGAILNTLLRRNRIKKGISVITFGGGKTGNLAMDNTTSFKETSVITIIDMPDNINEGSTFYDHFDTAMNLFAYHMSNIVIVVNDKKWIPYNFNASHPIYDIEKDFNKNVLNNLIPKIVAPIQPNKFSEFQLIDNKFDPADSEYAFGVNQFLLSQDLFKKTGLYPKGKKVDDLPFRNGFYRWIGKIHLDHRTGMSYGFLAWQQKTRISELINWNDSLNKFGSKVEDSRDYFRNEEDLYVILEIEGCKYTMKVPEVSVLTQRSGSDKTNININKDLIKIGLKNGRMYLQAPNGTELSEDYKPSFDTKVILAHSVGNAIVASIIQGLKKRSEFVDNLKEKGLAIAHWHGYLNPQILPKGWQCHGISNPHVACSTPQSAIYALHGKLSAFKKTLDSEGDYLGDIHIEPHHGTNIIFPTLDKLANFLSRSDKTVCLGNKFLSYYN